MRERISSQSVMRPVGLVTSSKVWKLPDDCSTSEAMQPGESGWSSSAPWARLVVIILLVIILQQCIVTQRLLLVLENERSERKNKLATIQMQKSRNNFGLSIECTGIILAIYTDNFFLEQFRNLPCVYNGSILCFLSISHRKVELTYIYTSIHWN